MQPFLDASLTLLVAVLIDIALGEAPLRIHPTAWMGRLITYGYRPARTRGPLTQKIYGSFLALSIIAVFAGGTYAILDAARTLVEPIQIILAAILLKPTFSLRLMYRYAVQLASAVKQDDYLRARAVVQNIVRRDPYQLNEAQVISAGIESVAENTADGITSPLFYFALFGVPGAFAYRAINTLDSVLGYRDQDFINLGWFSARLDTLANWLPARLTSILTLLSARLVGQSASNGWRILRRDRNRTESWSAGWLMSAMAGALHVRLEKPGFYELGDPGVPLGHKQLIAAVGIMLLNSVLFILLIVLPVMLAITMVI